MMLSITGCTVTAQDVQVSFSGDKAEVSLNGNDSVSVKIDGARVELESAYTSRDISVMLSGNSDNGRIILKSNGKASLKLNNLNLKCDSGAPIWLKNKKRVDIVAIKDTKNSLTISACPDTAADKSSAIWAKGKLHFSGKGKLDVTATGNGCKGISAKDNIKIENLTLNVITTGDNLGKDTTHGFGMGGFPPPPFGEMPEGFKFPEGMEMPDFSKMPPPPFMNGGMPGGFEMPESGDPDEKVKAQFKQKYIATCKAIKSQGTVTIISGKVYCKTSSAGAEGIEGKKGVTVSGGEVIVDAIDDAINANAEISFLGGKVVAESHCNDAIDANVEGGFPPMGGGFPPMGDCPPMGGGFPPMGGNPPAVSDDAKPGVIISGGEVYAFSHTGAPEEGIDCDFSPVAVEGGTVFTIGAGMGEMPSVPTQKSAKQPTVLFTSLNLTKGDVVEIFDGQKAIFSQTIPFTFRNSASLFTSPKLKKGKTYTLRTKDETREFSISEKFVIVRK